MTVDPSFSARPSAASRWTECTLSLALADMLGLALSGKDNQAKTRGSKLHTLAFECLTNKLQLGEIEDATTRLYVSECRGFANLEQSVPLFYEPVQSGTVDAWDFREGTLYVSDLKTGQVPVSAAFNLQLAIYAQSIIAAYKLPVKRLVLSIYQFEQADVWTCEPHTIAALLAPAVQAYKLYKQGQYRHSLAVCDWCPVKASCRVANLKNLITMSKIVNIHPDTVITDSEKVEILAHADGIRKYLDALEAELLERYNDRQELLPGTKLKEGARRKVWKLSESELIAKYGATLTQVKTLTPAAALKACPSCAADIDEVRNSPKIVIAE